MSLGALARFAIPLLTLGAAAALAWGAWAWASRGGWSLDLSDEP